MAPKNGMTRRELLTSAAGAAAAASLGGVAGCFPSVGGSWPDAGPDVTPTTCGCSARDAGASTSENQPAPVLGSSKVVVIQRTDSIDSKGKSLDQPRLEAVENMVNAVLTSLAGGADNPWSVILPDIDKCARIGLKVNCLNPYFGTSPAVVRAIVKSLVERGGVCAGNIIVWDRRLDELTTVGKYAGEHLLGAQLLGTYNSQKDPGKLGYSDAFFGSFQGSTPRLSNILLHETDFTINLPVLKTHGQSSVTAALKNCYGIIDIPGKYHTDEVAHTTDLQTALPALYAIPPIRNSIKLTIVDALRAVTNGDTASPVDAQPARIFGSLDPLALDYYAVDLINQLRASRKIEPVMAERLKWLENAHAMGLGAKSYDLVPLSPTGEPLDVNALDGGTPDAGEPDSAAD
jgi:uncharacterized protein (DUF362 family)